MTGSRGPLPKPTVLKLLQNNPGKRALNLADGVNPLVQIPPPPKRLGKEALKEWKRITPLLFELGLISGLDREALAKYCEAVGQRTELVLCFNGKVSALTSKGVGYYDAVFEVSHDCTPSGYKQQSVLVQLIRSHGLEIDRGLAQFGLSPSARMRVAPSNYVQLGLPGVEASPNSPVSGFAKFAPRGGA